MSNKNYDWGDLKTPEQRIAAISKPQISWMKFFLISMNG